MALGITKVGNEYADAAMSIDAPKAVWMAIALSLAMRITEIDNPQAENVRRFLVDEWRTLHENGIVPQRPRQ